MFSVMYTGMNLFPLCTASVWPTKSGVMVLRRDQVLNTFFSFFSFRAWIFTRSDGSTYGPFLTLRPIAIPVLVYCVAFPRFRPLTISFVDGFFLWRVDRKSTRLNSSHTVISYAVFCLKKKITNKRRHY